MLNLYEGKASKVSDIEPNLNFSKLGKAGYQQHKISGNKNNLLLNENLRKK